MKVIASWNGLEAVRLAYEEMARGADTLDAAIAGLRPVEDDPDELTVGYGGLPNEEGVVELDAGVMHGPTGRAGSVAGLRGIRYPAEVARLVMQRTDHVMLVGAGALRFARAHGFEEENLLSPRARKLWLYWKEALSGINDWRAPEFADLDPDVVHFFRLTESSTQRAAGRLASDRHRWNFSRPTGTIHVAAQNGSGEISCVTSTSGLAFKIAGRVSDSAVIGAGLFVDNEVGSCGSTGRGEANLQALGSHAVVELMRKGASPEEAGLAVLRRIAERTEDRLRDDDGRPDFDLRLYVLHRDGRYAGVSLWAGRQFAICDDQGARLEECVGLFERVR